MLKSLVNGKVYVDSTSLDVDRRLTQHNLGTNRWTKGNGPFKLVYYESYVCKTDAIVREKFYKSGVGKRIKNLIVKGFDINS